MSIAQGTISSSGTTVYTSTNATAITAVFLMNDHSGTVVLDVHVVKSGDSAAASNKIIKSLSINAADSYVLDTEKLLFDNGDALYVIADVDAVVHTTVSYIGV
jgi:hypothetical protein